MTTTTDVQYKVLIGMEIHVQLATRSKMFTGAANGAHPDHFNAPPNSIVDPVRRLGSLCPPWQEYLYVLWRPV